MKKRPDRAPEKSTIRLPPELHDEIREAAARAGHSMNAEIIIRLSARGSEITIADVARQNVLMQKMLQHIIDTLC